MSDRLIVVLTVSLFAGCAERAASDVSQIGARAVPATGERAEMEPLDWKTVEDRLAELGLTGASSVIEFVPDEGVYGFQETLFRNDECGFGDGSVEFDHDIQQVSAKYASYEDNFIERGEEDPALTTGCELGGHTYRCNSSKTVFDFRVLGLDAKVTVKNDAFGVWNAQSPGFTGAFPYELSCKGADCDREPASNLYGLITSSMPCTGIEAAKFGK